MATAACLLPAPSYVCYTILQHHDRRLRLGTNSLRPYGSATRTASYNPYTGTSTRTVSGSTYTAVEVRGRRNPYTGTYAATRRIKPQRAVGQFCNHDWESDAYTHHTTSQGTVGSVQVRRRQDCRCQYHLRERAAGRTANGDLYAGRDGNVYRNTGNGWEKYDNGNWNTATSPTVSLSRERRILKKSPTPAQTGTPQSPQNYQQRQPNNQVTPSTAPTQPRAQNSQQRSPTTAQTGSAQSAQNYQQRPPNNQVTPSTAQIQPRAQGYQPANSATTQNAGAQSNQQQRQQTSNQPAGSSTVPSLQQEAQNRQRGARETQRFQQSQSNRPGRRN